jgi:hypothetical protein
MWGISEAAMVSRSAIRFRRPISGAVAVTSWRRALRRAAVRHR